MRQEPATPTASKLSHMPGVVLGLVEAKDVLITRRGAEPVVVSTVTRMGAEHTSIAALIAAAQKTGKQTQVDLIQVMPQMYPWLKSLPEADLKAFVSRYFQVLAECAAHTDFQPLVILLTQWQYTASVYRDEKLMEALLAPIVEDRVTGKRAVMPKAGAPAPRPTTARVPASRATTRSR